MLRTVKQIDPAMPTKSGIMVGLGESTGEVLRTLADLREAGCDVVTIGQYLRPSPAHAPVERFYPPQEFDDLAAQARSLGFLGVAAGPFIRSSYQAGQVYDRFREQQA